MASARHTLTRTLVAALVTLFVLVLAPGGAGATPATSATPAPTTTSAPTTTAAGGATFGIGPADGTKIDGRAFFNYLSSPGGQLSDHVAVRNLSAQPLTLRVYATDAVAGSDGSISYLPGTSVAKDAGSWLSVGSTSDTGTLSVAAGAVAILPFTLKVPSTASPGDHVAALIVSLTSQIKNSKGQLVNFDQRVASKVYIRISGAITAKLGIDRLRASFSPGLVLNPFGRGDVTVSYRVRNLGNVILGAEQGVEVSGWYGGTERASALATIPALLPGESVTLSTKVSGVAPGLKLTISAQVTPVPPVNAVDPAMVTASASTSIWVVPWLPGGLVVALLGFGAGLGLWLRIQRKKKPVSRHRPLARSGR